MRNSPFQGHYVLRGSNLVCAFERARVLVDAAGTPILSPGEDPAAVLCVTARAVNNAVRDFEQATGKRLSALSLPAATITPHLIADPRYAVRTLRDHIVHLVLSRTRRDSDDVAKAERYADKVIAEMRKQASINITTAAA